MPPFPVCLPASPPLAASSRSLGRPPFVIVIVVVVVVVAAINNNNIIIIVIVIRITCMLIIVHIISLCICVFAIVLITMCMSFTHSPPIKCLDFRGFDSSRLSFLRGGNSHVR